MPSGKSFLELHGGNSKLSLDAPPVNGRTEFISAAVSLKAGQRKKKQNQQQENNTTKHSPP